MQILSLLREERTKIGQDIGKDADRRQQPGSWEKFHAEFKSSIPENNEPRKRRVTGQERASVVADLRWRSAEKGDGWSVRAWKVVKLLKCIMKWRA